MTRPFERDWFRKNILVLFCALVIAALYATSFSLPVLTVGNDPMYGWQAYLVVSPHYAWEQMLFQPGQFQALLWWAPNPLLWVGVVLLALGRGGSAAATGLLALPAGLSVALDAETFRLHFNELREGYFCWLASMAFLTLVGAWFGLRPVLWGNAEEAPARVPQSLSQR